MPRVALDLNNPRDLQRVKAQWRPREEWDKTMANIKWFAPTGEPDVPFSAIKDYL